MIDPDGGSAIPERDGFANGEIWSDADGKWKWENNMWVGQTSGSGNFLATVRIGGAMISQWNPDFADRWAESENFFSKASYSIVNGAGIVGQYLMGRSVGDSSMRNLDGSSMTTNQAVMDFVSFTTLFTGGESAAAKGVTTADGFLFKGFTIKAPFNIPVQRFGNMSLGRPDFWGLKIGTSKLANRTFAAIKPEWNPLTQYTTGVIAKGTPMKFGVIGPQGWKYPGGSLQFIVPSNNVINQSSKLIK